jgi:hemerythrin-like domain-containing protein
LRHATTRIRRQHAPDFRLLFALVDYIVAFPERLHHPKEDEHLFRALARRCADARPLLAELSAEHARGDELIGTLRGALARYAREGMAAFEPFAAAVDDYAAFHGRHMGREEELVLPLAQRHLSADDWASMDAAFRANDNPRAGLPPKVHVDALFRRVLDLLPAHAGAGTPAPLP